MDDTRNDQGQPRTRISGEVHRRFTCQELPCAPSARLCATLYRVVHAQAARAPSTPLYPIRLDIAAQSQRRPKHPCPRYDASASIMRLPRRMGLPRPCTLLLPPMLPAS